MAAIADTTFLHSHDDMSLRFLMPAYPKPNNNCSLLTAFCIVSPNGKLRRNWGFVPLETCEFVKCVRQQVYDRLLVQGPIESHRYLLFRVLWKSTQDDRRFTDLKCQALEIVDTQPRSISSLFINQFHCRGSR